MDHIDGMNARASRAGEYPACKTKTEERRYNTMQYKKLTLIHNKRIVSKSPGHFARIPSLKRIFPAGKFIVIVRNPYEVAASALRAQNPYGRSMALQARVDGNMPTITKSSPPVVPPAAAPAILLP